MSQRPASKPPAPKPSARKPVEVVTYRLDGELVYVTPGSDFEQAVDYARQAFPQLADVESERIAFAVNVQVNGAIRTVRIAPMAWRNVLSSLTTYELIDVYVIPKSTRSLISSRASKSDTDVRQSALDGELEAPPCYQAGSQDLLGADLKQMSEQSHNYTLTPAPQLQRSRSALGWLGRHL